MNTQINLYEVERGGGGGVELREQVTHISGRCAQTLKPFSRLSIEVYVTSSIEVQHATRSHIGARIHTVVGVHFFRHHCFTTYCNVWSLYNTMFSNTLILIYCLNMCIACIALYTGPPPPPPICTKLVYHTNLSLTIK